MPDFDATLVGLQPGQTAFGRYTLIRQLGRGGMGVVWLAQDEKLGREVALKFLPEVVAGDREAVADLKRETRRSLELTHPRIVRIYDFIDDGRAAAVSMEYVDGPTLSGRRREQPAEVFSAAELQPWVEQLCDALTYAHEEARIIHRDLKPANLMTTTRGVLKVADFGISATLSETATRASQQVGSSGTPMYMSPQQMMGEKPAVSDDLYALGATLYELLTGKPPFYSGNLFMQVQQKVPPSLAQRREDLGLTGLEPIPAAWEETIAACLAKEPEQRPASAREVRERLAGNGEATVLVGGGDATVRVMEPTFDEATVALNAPDVENDATVRVTPTEETAGDATIAVVPDRAAAPEPLTPPVPPVRSRRFPWPWVAALLVLVALAGWYLGYHRPEQARLAEVARQEAAAKSAAEAKEQARLEAEALRLRHEQEQAAAAEAAKQKAEQERAAAEAARLAAARGGVIVRTTPAGAEVRVGAVALERSPLTLKELKLGKYPVRVRLAGYEDWDGEVEVKENDFAELAVPLVRSTGTVELTSEPAGLEVEVRGERSEVMGERCEPRKLTTPAKVELPTGEYTAIYRRAGWPEQSRKLSVERRQRVSAVAEFVPGSVQLTSEPAGAEVRRAGKTLGTTPLTLNEVLPGAWSAELQLKGYKKAAVTGEVTPRGELTLAAALEKIPGPEEGQAWTIPDLGLELVPISAGSFALGSTNGDADERPVTQVKLTQPFWLGKYEVTQGQWERVMGSNPSAFKNAGANAPVEQVSYDEALAFCQKVTASERAAGRLPEGYAYTLPTEAQWEYACRAGTTGDYAGNLALLGWYSDNSGSTTHPVGQKQANAWGLYDLHGNVWEWCRDWYGNYPGGTVTDPIGAASGSLRVLRGGGSSYAARLCRSAFRYGSEPGSRNLYLGFRLALSSVP